MHLWQQGPDAPIRPIGFYFHSFKDTEKHYPTWEKDLFVASLVVWEAERTICQHSERAF